MVVWLELLMWFFHLGVRNSSTDVVRFSGRNGDERSWPRIPHQSYPTCAIDSLEIFFGVCFATIILCNGAVPSNFLSALTLIAVCSAE